MKRFSTLFALVLTALLAEASVAQTCTCGCGMQISQCLSSHYCEAAEQWYQRNASLHSSISVIGKAEGTTNDEKSFPETASAGGSVSLSAMTARRDLRTINGDWHANWVRTTSNPYAPNTTQEWRFMAAPKGDTPGQLIGTGRATISGGENGASGLIHGWKVVSSTGRLVNVTARVEFHGERIQITDFYEELSP